MNLWIHHFSQNTNKKLSRFLPSLHRTEILTIFGSYFGRNHDFINSFWNCLTFIFYSISEDGSWSMGHCNSGSCNYSGMYWLLYLATLGSKTNDSRARSRKRRFQPSTTNWFTKMTINQKNLCILTLLRIFLANSVWYCKFLMPRPLEWGIQLSYPKTFINKAIK